MIGKYKILIYNGDVDGVISMRSTYQWVKSLKLSKKIVWKPYHVEGQVSGYVETYDKDLTFASIHGAGHMSPQDKRPEAYHLIFNWIKGQII